MRLLVISIATTGLIVIAAAARGYPEGAPWGAAHPDAEQSCSSCHFDADPTMSSPALTVAGLPAVPAPATAYSLALSFAAQEMASAGFQILAVAGEHDAGRFSSPADDVESSAAAIRSSAVSMRQPVSWSFTWHSPRQISSPVMFLVAAVAANDDGSPLGDAVHYRSFTVGEPPSKTE